ncbi:ParA family protein [Bradyrhizobium sp. 13971]
MPAKVIAFINYKGGVAKTTTTYHVGCSLAQHFNKRVLFVDIDPQTNLTFLCGAIEEWEQFKNKNGTIADMYRRFVKRKAINTKDFIWREPVGAAVRKPIRNLDLIPCDIDLIGEDLGGAPVSGTFPSLQMLRRQSNEYLRERSFLRRAFKEIEDEYDYILIDCPPNLYLMTQNALIAANWYVVTAIPDHLSTIGLNILQRKVREIGGNLEAAQNFAGQRKGIKVAEIGGIVFVRARLGGSRITNVHRETMAQVQSEQAICFQHHTTELIGFGEAAEQSLPVWMTRTSNAIKAAGHREYENITHEFLGRFP